MQKPRVESDETSADHFTKKALIRKEAPKKFSLARAIMEKYEVEDEPDVSKPVEKEKREMVNPFAAEIQKQEEAGPPSPTANSPRAE